MRHCSRLMAKPSWVLKLERAVEHMKTIENEVAIFLSKSPYSAALDPNPQPWYPMQGGLLNEIYYIRGYVRQQPPPELNPIIGECLYNLRSGLDHIATHLAGVKADAKTEFPIFTDREAYWHGRSPRYLPTGSPLLSKSGRPQFRHFTSGREKVHGMSHRARAFIEHIQPYQGRYGLSVRHPLAVLADLMNQDKHRFPNLMGAGIVQGGAILRLPPPFEDLRYRMMSINWCTFDDGAAIANVTKVAGPGLVLKGNVRVEASFDVAFSPTQTRPGVRVVQTLEDIKDFIEGTILPVLPRL